MAGDANDVGLAARRVPGRLFYAPAPQGVPAVSASGYFLVGYDDAPERDWPGQVEYVLARERSTLRPHAQHGDEGMEEGTAVYVLATHDHERTR